MSRGYSGYINYESEERECSNCHMIKSFKEFTIEKNRMPPSSRCKVCRAEIQSNRVRERKLNLYPHLYYECDECDYIFRINLKYGKREVCPKCNSLIKTLVGR